MRKIAANYILPISSVPIKNGILVVDDFGKIIDIIDNNGNLNETAGLEFYNGAIIPGFVNCHCHLELSYLKNKIMQNNGLVNFIKNVAIYKNIDDDYEKYIAQADFLMYNNGINAVGDIANTLKTLKIKKESKIKYHTFVEILGLQNEKAKNIFENGLEMFKHFVNPKSIIPHAPYSVSKDLFKEIYNFSQTNNQIISIHNQENESENEIFFSNTGELFEFVKNFQTEKDNFELSYKTSIQTYLKFLPKNNNILLIHNIFTNEEDIIFAQNYCSNIYWCLCPNSNLYIENKLPQIDLFVKHNSKIVLGTDSLASNTKLDILEEIKTIQTNFDDINFLEIIKWATLNGAKALNINNTFGSLEIGKSPGILLIQNFDFQNMKLKQNSEIKRLI